MGVRRRRAFRRKIAIEIGFAERGRPGGCYRGEQLIGLSLGAAIGGYIGLKLRFGDRPRAVWIELGEQRLRCLIDRIAATGAATGAGRGAADRRR